MWGWDDDPRNEPDYGDPDDDEGERIDRAAERYESDLYRMGE